MRAHKLTIALADYCDSRYEKMRNFVAEKRNAEDLLYIKVAADRHLPPSLFVSTIDEIKDSGVFGLHSKVGNKNCLFVKTGGLVNFSMLWPGLDLMTSNHAAPT